MHILCRAGSEIRCIGIDSRMECKIILLHYRSIRATHRATWLSSMSVHHAATCVSTVPMQFFNVCIKLLRLYLFFDLAGIWGGSGKILRHQSDRKKILARKYCVMQRAVIEDAKEVMVFKMCAKSTTHVDVGRKESSWRSALKWIIFLEALKYLWLINLVISSSAWLACIAETG